VNKCDDHFTRPGFLAAQYNDKITVVDTLLDHRVALHLEHEVVADAASKEMLWNGDTLVCRDRLDWPASGNGAEKWNLTSGFALAIDDFDPSLLVPVPTQVALALKELQMLVNGSVRGVAEAIADLTMSRCDATGLDALPDKVENVLLALSEKWLFHGQSLRRKLGVSQATNPISNVALRDRIRLDFPRGLDYFRARRSNARNIRKQCLNEELKSVEKV
jgi:hypothetical protein